LGEGMLVSVCMFCKVLYGSKSGNGVSGISHGICPACETNALELLEQGVGADASIPLSPLGKAVAHVTV